MTEVDKCPVCGSPNCLFTNPFAPSKYDCLYCGMTDGLHEGDCPLAEVHDLKIQLEEARNKVKNAYQRGYEAGYKAKELLTKIILGEGNDMPESLNWDKKEGRKGDNHE